MPWNVVSLFWEEQAMTTTTKNTRMTTIGYLPDRLWRKVKPLLGPEKQPGSEIRRRSSSPRLECRLEQLAIQ